MNDVIEMRLPLQEPEVMYLTGHTLLKLAAREGRVLFDTDGTPVLQTEFYKVSAQGIERY